MKKWAEIFTKYRKNILQNKTYIRKDVVNNKKSTPAESKNAVNLQPVYSVFVQYTEKKIDFRRFRLTNCIRNP